jgi:hypothetical protein
LRPTPPASLRPSRGTLAATFFDVIKPKLEAVAGSAARR